MWVPFVFIGYLLIALLAPASWALWPTWHRARQRRRVTCPELNGPALVQLDSWYAVRKHALGDQEVRIRGCVHWPERQGCGRVCLTQIGASV